MLMSVMLMGVVSMFTTSCVQGDLYDDLYEDTDGWFAPRNKRSKGDYNPSNLADNCNLVCDSDAASQKDCVRACMQYIFYLSGTDLDEILEGRGDDKGVFSETDVDAVVRDCVERFNANQLNAKKPKEAKCVIVNGSSVQYGDIALITPGTKYIDAKGESKTLTNGHAFIVNEVNDRNSDCWVSGLYDGDARLFNIMCKKIR